MLYNTWVIQQLQNYINERNQICCKLNESKVTTLRWNAKGLDGCQRKMSFLSFLKGTNNIVSWSLRCNLVSDDYEYTGLAW